MKKIYLLGLTVLFGINLSAQNPIPNGDFEGWQSGAYDLPTGYSTSNPSTFFHCSSSFNVIRWPDPYHGSYAVKLNTNNGLGDTCIAYMVNSPNPGDNSPCLWNGGMAYSQVPTGIRGYYKCNVMPGDSAGILVGFRNGTTCLGFYFKKFAGSQNTYAPFQLNFNPPIAGTPDTMVFAAVSSDVFNNVQVSGSMLLLDSISFIGAAAPAAFDGDFESWQSVPVEKPMFWYVNGDDKGSGVLRTTDVQAGSYAVELTTYVGSNKNGNVSAHGAQISTGYYQNNCQGPNCQKGGFPFSNQVDTLCYYLKYNPVNGDTANTWVNFKKNGANVGGVGAFMTTATSNYVYFELPFNSGSAIDTAIVTFQSSSWRDTAVAFAGSALKVDEVHFKSYTTSIHKNESRDIKVFPNPSSDGSFVVSDVETFDLVRVYDVAGQEVIATIRKQNGTAHIKTDMPGVYTVLINSRGKVTNLKVIVGKN
jgi:hypothetical protein